MQITERQAYMVLFALEIKEHEVELCSDEYLFMVDLAKYVDPESEGYAHPDNIERLLVKAKHAKDNEETEELLDAMADEDRLKEYN